MMLEFFTDPAFRSATLGCMLMGLSSGIIGCLLFLKKRSLMGEVLSHSAYPGIVLGAILGALFFPGAEGYLISLGAVLFGLLGLLAIHFLENRFRISSDAALCFVLSLFFGLGILLVSSIQKTHPIWFRHIQVFLFGQAATMLDFHIILYAILTLVCIVCVIVLFRELELFYFDPELAFVLNVSPKIVQSIVSVLLVLTIVIGMRSVGVVLMSAMLIAPIVAARQFVSSLKSFFFLSGLFGLLSGFLGNVLSIQLPVLLNIPQLPLPTGPMIVMVAMTLCLLSLLFAPQRGYVHRFVRILRFQLICKQENVLKAFYKKQPIYPHAFVLWLMEKKGWIANESLTSLGIKEAEKLIRLHRLWEVYLVHMGQHSDRVHHSAEEMEHILTPEIEKQLTSLLDHPSLDPHQQPIPGGRG